MADKALFIELWALALTRPDLLVAIYMHTLDVGDDTDLPGDLSYSTMVSSILLHKAASRVRAV